MSEDNGSYVSRRTAIKGTGIAAGSAVFGGAGLWMMSGGAAAEVASSGLSGAAIEITSDGGDVTDIALTSSTEFNLEWEGYDADIDSVTFTLEAQRNQVGTGSDESTARGNLSSDSGSSATTLFTDTPPSVLSPGRNGVETYTSGDLATSFPFAIVTSASQGGSVEGTISDANIDASSLSVGTDGNVKVSEVELTLTAEVAAGAQSVTATTTGTVDIVVDNMAGDVGTGGTISSSGSGE